MLSVFAHGRKRGGGVFPFSRFCFRPLGLMPLFFWRLKKLGKKIQPQAGGPLPPPPAAMPPVAATGATAAAATTTQTAAAAAQAATTGAAAAPPAPPPTPPAPPPPPKQSVREVLRATALSTKQRCVSYSKGFGAMGALFAGSECVIEKARAKHDIYNAVYAGMFFFFLSLFLLYEKENRGFFGFFFSFPLLCPLFGVRFLLSPVRFMSPLPSFSPRFRSSSFPCRRPSHGIQTKNTTANENKTSKPQKKGCAAGGALAASGGIKAAGFGCVSFAAFSAFIEKVMQHD